MKWRVRSRGNTETTTGSSSSLIIYWAAAPYTVTATLSTAKMWVDTGDLCRTGPHTPDMPSTRRTFLAATGATVSTMLAGCSDLSRSDEPPAGSLRFSNDHSVPHAIRLSVVDVGGAPGDDSGEVQGEPDTAVPPSLRTLSTTAAIDPGETVVYEDVFAEPVWYAVRFDIDGERPEDGAGGTAFHPVPPTRDRGRLLGGTVSTGGEFSLVVSSTGDLGRFD